MTPNVFSRRKGGARPARAAIVAGGLALVLLAGYALLGQQAGRAPAAFPQVVVAQPATAGPRLTATLDRDAGDFVLKLGPIDLPAGATHHDVTQPAAQEVALPVGWLRGYRVELVDRSGKAVPQSVVHHLNLMVPDRRELFSPIMLRVGAVGHETKPVQLPFLMGFRVKEGEKLLITAMFSNEESKQSYEGVELRVHMPYTADGTWLPPFSVYPFYIDVMPPAGLHAYDLPPGKSQKSWDARPAVQARVLGVGGHLHKYGTLLRFEDVTDKKVLWEARPVVGADGDIASMPTGKFWWRGGVTVYPTHTYRLTAFYDNPTGTTVPDGGMGTLGGILVPSRGSTWPPANPADPDYRKDVVVTRGGMQMEMNMSGMTMPGMPQGGTASAGAGGAPRTTTPPAPVAPRPAPGAQTR